MQNHKVDNITVRGYSHELNNTECQDSSVSWQGKKYDAIIVCDGHGGKKYFRSRVGSQKACSVGKEKISFFMDKIYNDNTLYRLLYNKTDEVLAQLEKSIIQGWYEAVTDDMTANPFDTDDKYMKLDDECKSSLKRTPVKAYGSTFIASVLTGDFYFVLKLGDGNVCFLKKDLDTILAEEKFPDLKDDEWSFDVANSLCNSDADNKFQHAFGRLNESDEIKGILLSTDGVIKCYKSKEAYLGFIRNIFDGYWNQTREQAKAELMEFLPKLSKKGSGDDLSVAIIGKRNK